MRRYSFISFITVLGATLALTAILRAQMPKPVAAAPAAATAITIDNFTFTPQTLTVPAGTTVTWTNHDDIPHNVVNTDMKFRSHALDTDQSFSFSFTQAGTYEYFCSLHPRMVAKIVVEAAK